VSVVRIGAKDGQREVHVGAGDLLSGVGARCRKPLRLNTPVTLSVRPGAVADDIALPALYLLAPMACYINGVLPPVDGGQTLVL
jgi:hypothetical protein